MYGVIIGVFYEGGFVVYVMLVLLYLEDFVNLGVVIGLLLCDWMEVVYLISCMVCEGWCGIGL